MLAIYVTHYSHDDDDDVFERVTSLVSKNLVRPLVGILHSRVETGRL